MTDQFDQITQSFDLTDAALIIEDILTRWLQGTANGRAILKTRQLDDAIDASFELLNAGFIKIVGEIGVDSGHLSIEPQLFPKPPARSIRRIRRS